MCIGISAGAILGSTRSKPNDVPTKKTEREEILMEKKKLFQNVKVQVIK